MYRPSHPQKSLFDAGGLMPPEKRKRCEKTWAGPFREHALPLLRSIEDEFADLFDAEEGRPNRPVELVVGVLILKEMSDLTDLEALEALEYDLRWAYAFGREPGELHLSQKTLHNFRAKLMTREKQKLAFRRVTDELIRALGVKVNLQRLDSTHILSNIAVLNRLQLFCETIRVFLRALHEVDPGAYAGLPAKLRERHGEGSAYADCVREDRRRRLEVVVRDLARLIERFGAHEGVKKTPEWAVLERLFKEQCRPTKDARKPGDGDDDAGDGAVRAELKEGKEITGDSLQTPHDPEMTYSGHKGGGYEVQVAETCGEGPRLITEVEVTPSSRSDKQATVPVVRVLKEAGHKPKELVADSAYSGGENAAALSDQGVRLVAPATSLGKPEPGKVYPPPAPECPKDAQEAVEWLRQQEASAQFKERYRIRAGSESTNAELKGKHGMGRLRVRGGGRVRLAVYFKALACNLKRALSEWLRREAAEAEGAAGLA